MLKEPPGEMDIRRRVHSMEGFAISPEEELAELVVKHQASDPGDIWDEGSIQVDSWKDEKIVMHIAGGKLSGKYVLVNTSDRYGEGSWLFFRVE